MKCDYCNKFLYQVYPDQNFWKYVCSNNSDGHCLAYIFAHTADTYHIDISSGTNSIKVIKTQGYYLSVINNQNWIPEEISKDFTVSKWIDLCRDAFIL